ncbi:MAG: hypothetical protein JNK72_05015 [Myxococcales bacterium]|nr:hypothetical protein [Myxococcales bacterium]
MSRVFKALLALGLVGCGSRTLQAPDRDAARDDVLSVVVDDADPRPVDADDDAGTLGDVLSLVQDTPIVEDLPAVDAQSADAAAGDASFGDASPRDAGALCPAGALDRCPSPGHEPCTDLADGLVHRVVTAGLGAELPASCEGELTRVGPDAALVLTLLNPSDVVLTARATGIDAVALTLTPYAQCGQREGELRCQNSSAGGTSGVATVRAVSLAAGRYIVGVSSARSLAVDVQAVVSAPGPRARGDVCPGVAVQPDGPLVSVDATSFAGDADYLPGCMSQLGRTGLVDAVFSYTLTEARDVAVEVAGSGAGELALELGDACGARSTMPGVCATGNPVRAVARRQPAGTYFATVHFRGAARLLSARVRTQPATPASPHDQCPGSALSVPGSLSMNLASLGPDSAPACLSAARADAFAAVTAPSAGLDLVAVARGGSRDAVSIELRDRCDRADESRCTAGVGGLWRRFGDLASHVGYTLTTATTAIEGSVSVEVLTTPRATPVTVLGNTRCELARPVTELSAVFHGATTEAGVAWLQSPCGASCNGGRAVWYRLDLAARQRVLLSTVGSGFDTLLAVFAGSCGGRLVGGACNDDAVGSASQLDLTLDPGRYFVALSGCGSRASGDYTLDLVTAAPRR